MRRGLLLLLALLGQPACAAHAGAGRLAGCAEAENTAAALARLRARGWTAWTPQDLVKAWPWPLTSLDCQSSPGRCVLLGRKGRSGEGSCECCETFHFDAEDAEGAAPERLSAVMVYYSAKQHDGVLSAARLLAKTMGLPDSENTLKEDQGPPRPMRRHFEWTEASPPARAVLDLEISKDEVWTAYLRVAWHASPD